MNTLSNLKKNVTKSKKRIGRGYGSGVGGHTTNRGNKGQKARYKIPLTMDGSKIKKSWLKRLPFLRGKGRNNPFGDATILFRLSQIDKYFKDGDTVSIKTLSKATKVSPKQLKNCQIKILSSQIELTKKLIIDNTIKSSQTVKHKILKAGGKII